MTDQFDRAQDLALLDQQSALAKHQAQAARQPKLQAKGECLNPVCAEPFIVDYDGDQPVYDPSRLFCGASCAENHAKLTRK